VKRLPVIVLGLATLVGVVVLIWPRTRESGPRPLICYVGGTMTPVFNELSAAYRKATGRKVDVTSADSGELLATIEMQLRGDLYVAHDPFMDVAMRRGLGVNAWCLGELHPVIVVRKGNPKGVKSLRDLMLPDVRVYLTDYQHSTLGQMLPAIFKRAGVDFEEFNRAKAPPTHRSGSWVANQIIMGAADAALVWQVVAALRAEDLDVVPLGDALPQPGVDTVTSATGRSYFVAPVKVAVVSLACSRRQRDIEDFVSFVISDAGRRIFAKAGFQISGLYGHRMYANGVRQDAPSK
jgi:molybdate transport system substrate-binding protein